VKQQRRILIIGADGLRPDLIDSSVMPTVTQLARSGVRCWDHHAVYPTHTRVNMSTLTTGATPGRHGMIANTMIVPGVTDDHIVETSNYQHINALERASNGNALLIPSLGDLLVARGERLAVAATSSPGAAMLWTHRHLERIVNTNSAYGIADLYDLREKLGELPEEELGPQLAAQRYATRALIQLFLADPLNRVIVLWLNEPDTSQHYFGLGSPEAVAALRGVDACVGAILKALDERHLRDQFDIFFISDHGHSTVQAHNTLRIYLAEAFKAIGYTLPLITASDYIYTQPGAQPPTATEIAPLVAWLVAQPWAGVVFAGRPDLETLPGVIPLAAIWNQQRNERLPLLAVSPRWSSASNEWGIPGQVLALTTQAALRASHGSAAPYDLHATLIANGPDFRSHHNSLIPTGAIDLLPTILTLLEIPHPPTIDGRVLWEIFAHPQGEPGDVQHALLEPTIAAPDATAPAQIALHRVGHTTYLHGALQGDAFYPPMSPSVA